MLIANGTVAMTEMRRATWSGLDGRIVVRRERRPREAEPVKSTGAANDEAADETVPASPVSTDPASD
jgi:hypothetical protein